MEKSLKPTNFEVKTAVDGQAVLLCFEGEDAQTASVEIPIHQLPALVRLLQGEIEPGQETPIDLASLRPGASVAVSQIQVSATEDGGVRISLGANLLNPERFVTIPLVADRSGAWGFLEDLVRVLKRGD